MFKILNKIKYLHLLQKRQRGAALMVMLVILILGAAALLLNSLSSSTLHIERDKITADALAQAKEALIGYATTLKLTSATYPDRPGDLPCPDNHPLGDINEGSPSTPCSGNALGRLPWKKLGLPDLHDGSGERLWYAVSTNFKNSPRIGILNSDTVGTITVRAPDGSLLNDGSNSSGAVALIIAPGDVLQRTDKPSPQDRSSTGYIDPENYLDIANGENNATFTDNSVDGFIQGSIKDANNHVILNDQILVITHDSIMQSIQKRVAKEVVNALNKYYCGDINVNPAGGCLAAGGNRYYPSPADFTDASCLSNGDLISCNSAATTSGRIPATPATAWSVSSILRGSTTNNWFQANAWREVMFYAVANACTSGTPNCTGSGYLTLNNPPGTALSSQKVVVIATGNATPTQNHSIGSKNIISNYLEDVNLLHLSDTYTRNGSAPFNDIAISIP